MTELLELPVQLHGFRVGQPVDLVLDESGARAVGLVVLCGDESERFLVLNAAELREDEIAVDSAFLLLDDVDFYRRNGRSARELLNGRLGEIVVGPDGAVGYPRGGVSA